MWAPSFSAIPQRETGSYKEEILMRSRQAELEPPQHRHWGRAGDFVCTGVRCLSRPSVQLLCACAQPCSSVDGPQKGRDPLARHISALWKHKGPFSFSEKDPYTTPEFNGLEVHRKITVYLREGFLGKGPSQREKAVQLKV